ncbi:hypothetical protein [Saccharicrinis aurantiacus]|uniref:hypothetical protein n=1 Tax=Saccharicrinis aurantiacus TaxID=1849719 RepID=UPI00094FF9EF|nr:hypothetical protein [Saccharicrinis aurantiacus]
MKESTYEVLKESLVAQAIELKQDQYETFINGFFLSFSDKKSVRDLCGSAILNCTDDYIGFAMDMGKKASELKELLQFINKEEYLRELAPEFKEMVKCLAIIVRGTTKPIQKCLDANRHMSDEVFEKFARVAYPYKFKRINHDS